MARPEQPCPKCGGSSWIEYGKEPEEVFICALVAGKRLEDGTFETDLSRVVTVNPFACPKCGYIELYKDSL